jgi:hypothetical protein
MSVIGSRLPTKFAEETRAWIASNKKDVENGIAEAAELKVINIVERINTFAAKMPANDVNNFRTVAGPLVDLAKKYELG